MASEIDSIDIRAFLRRGAAAGREKRLLSSATRALDGAAVADLVARAAEGLKAAGVRSGDRVALVLPDFVERVALYWAALEIDAFPVVGADDAAHVAPDDAVWLVASSEFALSVYTHGLRVLFVDDLLLARASPSATLGAPSPEDEFREEGAIAAWTFSPATPTRPQPGLAGRSHRNVAYVGLLGSFAINGDRSQCIVAVGRIGPTLFEALLFASVIGGAEVRHLQPAEVQDAASRDALTWVVEAPQAAEVIASWQGHVADGASIVVAFDPETVKRGEGLKLLAAADERGISLRPLLVDAFEGIVAEYDFEASQWRGFAGVEIGVAAGAGAVIAQQAGASGGLVLRSPQLSVHREYRDGPSGFPADGWARLPLAARLTESGFQVDVPALVHARHDGFAPVTAAVEAEATGLDVAALLERSARWRGQQPAVEIEGQRLTYAQLQAKAKALADVLAHHYDIGVGDRVAILSRNSVEFVALYLAANRLGAIFVPVNFRLKSGEVAYVLRDSGAKLLVHSQELSELIDDVSSQGAWAPRFACIDPETTIALPAGAPTTTVPTAQRAEPDEKRPASILYTAGTTGFPKGAVRSNRNVLWFSILGVAALVRTLRGQNHIVTTPMFHITGHEPSIVGALTGGGFTRILSEFKVDKVLDQVIEFAVPSLFVPPTIGFDLLDRIEQRGLRESLRHFKFWSSASAPLPGVLLARIHRLLPWVEVSNTLGMTEAGSIATHLASAGAAHPPGCIGRATVAAEVSIVDTEGRPLPVGVPGEIVVRSPQVIARYWNNPRATAASINERWFHGGDIGVYDAAGNIEIKGRLKDMIITGGENVYAAEVENVILSLPEIKETAVYGLPDARWGEAVTAAVVLREGASLTADEVIKHCRSTIAHYKCPKRVIYLPSLPRNPMGKVMKFALPDGVESPAESVAV